MLIDRAELEKYISKRFEEISKDRNKLRDISMGIEEDHGYPADAVLDIMNMRTDIQTVDKFVLFCIIEQIDNDTVIKQYFTKNEIEQGKYWRYKDNDKDSIEFPLIFKMCQVTENQWIGSINFRKIMKLMDKNLIMYNTDTQRVLKRVVKNGIEEYRISINKSAVKNIKNSFIRKTYIPDTITLNIRETDDKADYYYDGENLVIESITSFDIIDGYHRYQAFNELYLIDNTIDYPMELRITSFGETYANQFIWQEDQKTKMPKADSDTFNKHNPVNQLIDRLNEDPSFDLCGQIKKVGGNIEYSKLAASVTKIVFNGRRQIEKKEIIEWKNRIRVGINSFVNEFPEYVDTEWNSVHLAILIYGIVENLTPNEIKQKIDRCNINTSDIYSQRGGIKNKAIDLLREV